MKIVTFVGYTKHLDELDFDYVIVDKYFNDMTEEQFHDYKDRIIWNNTQEPNLRLRINKQLRKVITTLENVNDNYFAIIDSDLIIPNLRKIGEHYRNIRMMFSPCYYANHKGKNYIATYCLGTNFIFHESMLDFLKTVLYMYDNPEIPVDSFIHYNLPASHIIIPGTKHYVKTENGEVPKIITENDWSEAVKYNKIPIQVIKL